MLEGFGPEPGEVAEPIAMGRQTLWGGAGKPPSREVMAAAAKAARQDMMQRIRDNKASGGGAGGPRQARGDGQGPARPSRNAPPPSRRQGPAGEARLDGQGEGRRFDNRGDGQGRGPRNGPRPEGRGPNRGGAGGAQERRREDGDELPRHIDPLKTTQFARLDLPNRKPVRTSGQPDPTRTSIDSLASGNRRHGGGGGGGGFGGGNRGGKPGGGRGFGR
jgi:ATP-dependent RNA helicase RhlE